MILRVAFCTAKVNFNVHVKLQCVQLKERGGRGYMPSNSYAVDKYNVRYHMGSCPQGYK